MQPKRLSQRRPSDAELIALSQPDAAGFSELYTRHVAEVHAWLSRRLAWAASDLTAETFARAFLTRERFRDDHGGSALPWLLGIARNVLLETVRQDRVETRAREWLGLPLDLATEDGFTEVEDRLSPRLALERHVNALPPGEREALELRVIDELPYDEVAEQLDIRPTAARLRVSRALRRLAHTVPKEEA
jgi:RNA polymerase sigma-70 factor (ECF subfamily)